MRDSSSTTLDLWSVPGRLTEPTEVAPATSDTQKEHGQFMTPEWAARELIAHYFGDLTGSDSVIEPSCGEGAFLRALPDFVPAIGVEIDSALAKRARESSGREIIVGDFVAVDIQMRPSAIIGNPPFQLAKVQSILDRAWSMLPNGGRVGFILPCYTFQTADTVVELNRRWSIRQDMLPRNLFPGLSLPLCFAMLTKAKGGKLFGFSLYHELAAVNRLQKRYRALLAQGQRNVWTAVTIAALQALGGEAELSSIYAEVEGNQPTKNEFWRAKVRQQLQKHAVHAGPARWRIESPMELAA
ncbi:MAG: class I SAM-dependent methyltransferase [Rhodanobacter sp.]